MVDAGGANLGSVRAALERLGATPELTRDPARIAAADRMLLPGVGAAAPVMAILRDHGLVPALREAVFARGVPLLGICIGMQVLFEHSEEGAVDGLGWLPGRVRRLPAGPGLRLPHMGWNALQPQRAHPLLEGVAAGQQAYFVHSYAVDPGADTLATCSHGREFAALVARANLAGVQFHPERSGAVGARLLANFLRWSPA